MSAQIPVRMLDALTGLRFVAALCVFVHHARERFRIDSWNLGSLGGVAVGFFFVLSGFILTHVYGATMRRESVGAFYKARFARIWPLHIACLVAFFVLIRHGSPPQSSEEFARLARHVLLLQSWTTDLSSALDLNGVAWSISVELFFYACFPLLCLVGNRRFFVIYGVLALLTALALTFGEIALARDPGLRPAVMAIVHVLPPMRLLEFATGIAAARLVTKKLVLDEGRVRAGRELLLELAGVASVVFAYLLFGPAMWIERVLPNASFPVLTGYLPKGPGYALPFAVLIVVMARSTGLIARMLASKPIVFLGEVSFSFYMIHAIVLMVVEQSHLPDWRVSFAVALVLAVAASTLLYSVVEMPMREAMLRFLAGDARAALRRVVRIPRELVTRVPACVAIVILVVAPFALKTLESRANSVNVAGRIAEAPAELRDVEFADEAVVLAAHAQRGEREMEVFVAYRKLATASRSLFLHVAGADGEVLRQLAWTEVQFEDEQGRACIFATARAPLADLADAHSIGVGFWSRERGAARASRGPLSMGGHRLDLFEFR